MRERIHLIDLPEPGKALVFGMSWQPLLGIDLQKQAKRIAGEAKATHYFVGDSTSASLGLADLGSVSKDKLKKKLVSAGALYARENKQNVNISSIPLPGDESGLQWVIACHDGVVIKGTDKICTKDEAVTLLNQVKKRYPYAIWKPATLDKQNYATSICDLEEHKTFVQSVPSFARYGALALVLSFVGSQGWAKFKAYETEQYRKNHVEQQIDVPEVWRSHLKQWADSVNVHGKKGLDNIYGYIGSMPVRLGNWSLIAVNCQADARAWNCKAEYLRSATGTTKSFLDRVPSEWTVRWDGLGNAIAYMNVPAAGTTLNLNQIPTADEVNSGYIADLQSVLPSFVEVKMGEDSPVNIPVPKVRNSKNQMEAIPFPTSAPGDLRLPKSKYIQFSAPMRSLSLLPVTPMTVFNSISMKVNNDIGIEASMVKSMLMIELKGEMYVY